MQLNNPGVQKSVHQALQEDPNFTNFIEGVEVSIEGWLLLTICCLSSLLCSASPALPGMLGVGAPCHIPWTVIRCRSLRAQRIVAETVIMA